MDPAEAKRAVDLYRNAAFALRSIVRRGGHQSFNALDAEQAITEITTALVEGGHQELAGHLAKENRLAAEQATARRLGKPTRQLEADLRAMRQRIKIRLAAVRVDS